jgi:hypothetical protein
VDGGYTGTLIEWAKQMFGYDVEVVKRNEQHLFCVLPQTLDCGTDLGVVELVTPLVQGL